MTINKLSAKQKLTMNWWKNPKYRHLDAVICDGAVRSGKTLSMSLGFMLWSSSSFDGGAFAVCGKTVTSLRRNVITPLLPVLAEYGFVCCEKVSSNYIDITFMGHTNRFYQLYGDFNSQLTVYKEGVLGIQTAQGGHDESDNFAVHYGYTDNSGFSSDVLQICERYYS